MAGVFDPQLGSPSVSAPYIERPVQDQVTPAVAGLVTKGIIGIARNEAVSDLTGSGKLAAEAGADESLLPQANAPEQDQVAALESIDTLSKLASARKAGLPIGQARTRATAILKRAVNDNPLFADDVRKAYNNFFGGTGAGSIFELTAEEKAIEKYKGDVMTRSLELNIAPEVAAQSIRKEQQNSLLLKEFEVQGKERSLNADGFVNYAQINATDNVDNVMRGIISEVKNTGAISPERTAEYKAQLKLLGVQLKRQQNALLRDETGRPILDMVDRQGIDAANKLIDDQVNNAISLLDDQTALKLSTDNYTVLNNNFNTAVIKNFGQFKAIKDALGEQGSALYFQKMLGNEAFTQVAQNDPFVKSVLASGENFKRDFMNATSKAMSYSTGKGGAATLDNESKAGMLYLLGTDATQSALKQLKSVEGNRVDEAITQSVKESPQAVTVLKNETWKRRIATDPMYKGIAGAAMAGAAKSAKISIMSDLDSFDISGINLRVAGGPQTPAVLENFNERRGFTDIYFDGDLSGATRSKIQGMYDVARQNPSLWEGDHSDALGYVKTLLGLQKDATQPATIPNTADYTDQERSMIPSFISDSKKYQSGEVDKEYMMRTYPPEFVRKVLREYKGGN